MSQVYLTTQELAERIKYDARTIRERLKDSVLLEGIHYIRPFGGRKILYIWDVIEQDMLGHSANHAFTVPMAGEVFAVGKIAERPETGKLFFDFRYSGKRCREQTTLDNTPKNRKKLESILNKIEAEITLGLFEYHTYFPNSSLAQGFTKQAHIQRTLEAHDTPLFKEFSNDWFEEMKIQWRQSHISTIEGTLRNYLNPCFGEKEVGHITKKDVLEFRASLAKVTTRSKRNLSASRINKILTPLRMILSEAANRFEFSSPYHGIKSLRVPRTDVEPFSIEEVKGVIEAVRSDFRNYYVVRFFTGLRTGEIDGLQWEHVDFTRRQILVRQALVEGRLEYTKNDGSFRTIEMSQLVVDAMLDQQKSTGGKNFIFCTRTGSSLSHRNVTKRVWYPLLSYLCVFQTKVATDSRRSLPPIPRESCH